MASEHDSARGLRPVDETLTLRLLLTAPREGSRWHDPHHRHGHSSPDCAVAPRIPLHHVSRAAPADATLVDVPRDECGPGRDDRVVHRPARRGDRRRRRRARGPRGAGSCPRLTGGLSEAASLPGSRGGRRARARRIAHRSKAGCEQGRAAQRHSGWVGVVGGVRARVEAGCGHGHDAGHSDTRRRHRDHRWGPADGSGPPDPGRRGRGTRIVLAIISLGVLAFRRHRRR